MITKKINILEIPVLYINLKEDIDKNYKIRKQLKQYEFKYIIRVDAFKGVVDKKSYLNKWQQKEYIFACSRSYLKALNICKETPFIFLEDDAKIFDDNFKSCLEIPKDCDILYLGGSDERCVSDKEVEKITLEHPFIQTKNKNILLVNNKMTNTHAFLVLNEKIRKSISNKIYENIYKPQDFSISLIHEEYNFYAYNPPIFYQDGANSLDPYKVVKNEIHDC